MIQRIQSVYLGICILIFIIELIRSYRKNTIDTIHYKFYLFTGLVGGVYVFFIYENLPTQFLLTRILSLLPILMLIEIIRLIILKSSHNEGNFSILKNEIKSIIFVLLLAAFLYRASNEIKSDIALINSMNRLR